MLTRRALGQSLASLGALAAMNRLSLAAADTPLWVFIGTYTNGASKGIYRMTLDPASGNLSAPELAAEVTDPSFLAIHPSGKYLYSVNEVAELNGEKAGAVTAFKLNATTGSLEKINHQSSKGGGPCHLVVDPSGKNVLVANYGGGSVACLPIAPDGSLQPATSFVQHEGSSINKSRQSEPHAHSINVDPTGKYAVAADLGLDKVLIYKLDADKGTLTPNTPPSVSVAPGSGPRHFAFHPDGKHAYVINEIANTIDVFAYDSSTGTLTRRQTITTLPPEFQGTSHTAEVVVHPSGKFVYGSNRGDDSLAIFAVDAPTGTLTAVGVQPTLGQNPRNFAIDPTGQILLAENGTTNTIAVFRINPSTGLLTQVGQPINIPSPVCARFLPRQS